MYLISVKEPAWELFSSVNLSMASKFDVEELLTLTPVEGLRVLSYPKELKDFNMTFYKKPVHYGLENFLQVCSERVDVKEQQVKMNQKKLTWMAK